MKLSELAEKLGAQIVANLEQADEAEVERFHISDRLSDLLNCASKGTLLVTGLVNAQLARVAELMDAPGICLLDGLAPDPPLLKAASQHGIVLIISEFGREETADSLRACGLEELRDESA
jgi:ribosome assembly protein YihI (activator of Der GTPase)